MAATLSDGGLSDNFAGGDRRVAYAPDLEQYAVDLFSLACSAGTADRILTEVRVSRS